MSENNARYFQKGSTFLSGCLIIISIGACSGGRNAQNGEGEKKSYSQLRQKGDSAFADRQYEKAEELYREALLCQDSLELLDLLLVEEKDHAVRRLKRIQSSKGKEGKTILTLKELQKMEQRARDSGEFLRERELLMDQVERLEDKAPYRSTVNSPLERLSDNAIRIFRRRYKNIPYDLYEDLLMNDKVSFLVGFTYQIPVQKLHRQYQHDNASLVWTELDILKGDLKVAQTVHEKISDHPELARKLTQDERVQPLKTHSPKTLDQAMVDTIGRRRMRDQQGKVIREFQTDSLTVGQISGIRFVRELYFDQEKDQLGSRLNYVLPLWPNKQDHGKRMIHQARYGVSYKDSYESVEHQNVADEHPFHKTSVDWGIKPVFGAACQHKKGIFPVRTSARRISMNSYDHIGTQLIRAEDQDKIELYATEEGEKKLHPSYSRNEMKDLLVREIVWFNEEKGRFHSKLLAIALIGKVFHPQRPEYLSKYKTLFWYLPHQEKAGEK